jgi:hypothetical protein
VLEKVNFAIVIWFEGGVVANRACPEFWTCETEVVWSLEHIKEQVRRQMCTYNASLEIVLVS